MKNWAFAASAIVVGITGAALTMSKCANNSKTSNSETASLSLELGNISVDSIHYVLSNQNATLRGDLDVSSTTAASPFIRRVPAGSNYVLTVSAEEKETGARCSGTSRPFAAEAGHTTSVGIDLACRPPRRGTVPVNSRANLCPTITSVTADPSVGNRVDMHVAAIDPDDGPEPLAITWTGAGLSDIHSANPTYTCSVPGFIRLVVKASDGDSTPSCEHAFAVTVACPATADPRRQGEAAGSIGAGGSTRSAAMTVTNGAIADGAIRVRSEPLGGDSAVGMVGITGEIGAVGSGAGETGGASGSAGAGGASGTGGAAGTGGTPGTGGAAGTGGTPGTGGSTGTGGSEVCAQFNAGGPCTPTEQRFVNKSVDCYNCMVNAGCLDDDTFKETGHECGDVVGSAAAGPRAGVPRSQLCLDTLDCILANSCASSDVTICYCGSLGAGIDCAQAPVGAPNGTCLAQELAGLEFDVSTPASKLLPFYTDLMRGGGIANQLLNCARSNDCGALCSQ